jgi:glycosyltransferase involved in cell wall biosynthesis
MRAKTRRRILVLTPRDPYPTHGGDVLRIQRIAQELSKRYDLTLLTLCRSESARTAPLPDDGVFKEVHRVVLPTWRSWVNTLAALPTREPLQIAYYRSEEYRQAVRELAPSHDAVLAHLVRTADYVRDLPGPRILEMTDAISMSMQRTINLRAEYFDPRRILYRIEANRLAAHERRIADDFDLVSLTSAVDSEFLFDRDDEDPCNVMVVPNGSDIPFATPPAQRDRQHHEIAFVGNMRSLQNFDAAWFFANRVLPKIRNKFGNAVLRIIGPIGPLAARRLGKVSGVRIEGIVPRLDVALSTARVGVCPVRINAGVQNKVLDYFANRLAVVCSPNGLEGLEARDKEHLLIADTADEWVAKVTRLFEDVPAAQRLADAGRALVCDRYRWERCARPLLTKLDSFFAQPSIPQFVEAELAAA